MRINNAINLDMELTVTREGLDMEFECGMAGMITEKLNKAEIEVIKSNMAEICEVIGNAIDRDVKEGLKNNKEINEKVKELETIREFADMKCKEIYDRMSDEEKKIVNEVEARVEKAETNEEKINILLGAIKDTLTKGI